MFTTEDLETFDAARDEWGDDAQFGMLCEELAECIAAMSRHRRGRTTGTAAVAEEIADAQIMLGQWAHFIGEAEVSAYREVKLDRLRARIAAARKAKDEMAAGLGRAA